MLPVYFWFAQLVSFWFTLTALSLFLPYERYFQILADVLCCVARTHIVLPGVCSSPAAQVTGHVVYVGHGFMDNFLIVLGFFRSYVSMRLRCDLTCHLTRYGGWVRQHRRSCHPHDGDGGAPHLHREGGAAHMLQLERPSVWMVLYVFPDTPGKALRVHHGLHGYHTSPQVQAGYMDMALAVAYLAIIAAAIIPGCEKYRPRSTILPWTCFMAVGCASQGLRSCAMLHLHSSPARTVACVVTDTTVSIAALLNMAHMDAGLCVESAAVYICTCPSPNHLGCLCLCLCRCRCVRVSA